MITEVLTVAPDRVSDFQDEITRAVNLLKSGEVAALPTETVYGLAADAKNVEAVRKIFEAKGRPQDNPLIVHIATLDQLYEIAEEVPEAALTLADRFWPGPLTMIFKKKAVIPDETSGGLDTVAVRMPSNPIIREVIRQGELFIAAPSANLSGRPSCTNAADVLEDFGSKIGLILDGGSCDIGLESTVLSMVTEPPTLFRPGFVTAEELTEILGRIEISDAILSPIKEGERVQSPGMKYRHYSPKADVVLVRSSTENYNKFVKENESEGVFALCFEGEKPIKNTLFYGKKQDAKEQARNIFAALRQLDRLNAKKVYIHCPATDGIALATFNRLLRAAAFQIIDL